MEPRAGQQTNTTALVWFVSVIVAGAAASWIANRVDDEWTSALPLLAFVVIATATSPREAVLAHHHRGAERWVLVLASMLTLAYLGLAVYVSADGGVLRTLLATVPLGGAAALVFWRYTPTLKLVDSLVAAAVLLGGAAALVWAVALMVDGSWRPGAALVLGGVASIVWGVLLLLWGSDEQPDIAILLAGVAVLLLGAATLWWGVALWSNQFAWWRVVGALMSVMGLLVVATGLMVCAAVLVESSTLNRALLPGGLALLLAMGTLPVAAVAALIGGSVLWGMALLVAALALLTVGVAANSLTGTGLAIGGFLLIGAACLLAGVALLVDGSALMAVALLVLGSAELVWTVELAVEGRSGGIKGPVVRWFTERRIQ